MIQRKKKKQYRKGEHLFEYHLATNAPLFGCKYSKIADPNQHLQSIIREITMGTTNGLRIKEVLRECGFRSFGLEEKKRIADGILHTPNGNYIIEAKYNDGALKTHQKESLLEVNRINGTYFVVRKVSKVKKGKYIHYITIEQPEKVVLKKVDGIEGVYRYFKALSKK